MESPVIGDAQRRAQTQGHTGEHKISDEEPVVTRTRAIDAHGNQAHAPKQKGREHDDSLALPGFQNLTHSRHLMQRVRTRAHKYHIRFAMPSTFSCSDFKPLASPKRALRVL